MTIEELVVQIKADPSNAKRNIKDLQKELDKTSEKVQNLRRKLKEMDDSGLDWQGQKPYEELIAQLEEAEEKQYELTEEVENYQKAQEQAGEVTEQASEKIKVLGYNVETVAKRFFGLYAILRVVKQSFSEFMEDNEGHPLTETLTETQDGLRELRKNLVEILGPFTQTMATLLNSVLTPLNEWLDGIFPQYDKIQLEVKETALGFKDLARYQEILNKGLTKTKDLVGGFDELNILRLDEQEVDTAKEIAELEEYRTELTIKRRDLQNEIYDIVYQYADKLGLTYDQFMNLWEAWNTDDSKYIKLVADYGLNDQYWDVVDIMRQFGEEGVPAINQKMHDIYEVDNEIAKVDNLIYSLLMSREQREAEQKAIEEGRGKQADFVPLRRTGNPNKSKEEGGYNYIPNAVGGVYTSPTVGLVAEYSGASTNPEIVTPQSLMLETMATANGMLADVIAQATAQVVSAISNQNLEVTIGDDVIASSAARGNKAYYNMTGSYMI